MNLIEHAKNELDYAGLFDNDSDYNGEIGKAVMELIQTFSNQEHSGASASIVCSIFNQLAQYKPLRGITGEDSEWTEVSSGLFQNKRLSAVFKDFKIHNNQPYYLDAISWRIVENGSTWHGSAITRDGIKITSRQLIKSFPFIPKTFIIDVNDNVDDFIITEESMKRLEEVFQYYDKY
jgi:hypothetical protein